MARPEKPAEQRLSNRVNIGFTDAEWAAHKHQAATAGLALSAYFRECLVGNTPVQTVLPSTPLIDRETFAELRRIGVNLNQIAYRLNALQTVGYDEVVAVASAVEDFLFAHLEAGTVIASTPRKPAND